MKIILLFLCVIALIAAYGLVIAGLIGFGLWFVFIRPFTRRRP